MVEGQPDDPDREKISKDALATDKVQLIVGGVLDCLQSGLDGRIVNGSGIYADSSSRYRDLDTTFAAVKAAIEIMCQTDWPTDAQFRAVDA